MPALLTTTPDYDAIRQLIGDHVQDKGQRDRLLAFHSFNERMANAALSFICSTDGEDAATTEDVNDMRQLAIENGGDVGEEWCTLDAETCDHHEHAA